MIEEVQKKLNIKNIKNHFGHGSVKIHFITHLKDTPEHIKYRYTALVDVDASIKQVGLELVTLIDDSHVPFKEIFVFNSQSASSYDATVLEHVNLFLELIHNKSTSLIVE